MYMSSNDSKTYDNAIKSETKHYQPCCKISFAVLMKMQMGKFNAKVQCEIGAAASELKDKSVEVINKQKKKPQAFKHL